MSFPVNITAFQDPSSNFTIPYDTWYDLSNELFTILKLGFPRLETQMITALLMTISMVFYTFFAIAAGKALVQKGLRGISLKLLCITAVMYVSAFVYWITVVVGQFRTFHKLASNLWTTSSLVSPLDCFLVLSLKPSVELATKCSTIPDVTEFIPIEQAWDFTQECAGTVALTLNVTLGDAIVWWRVWVLWERNRLMLLLCSLLLLATLSMGITDASYTCSGVLSSFRILGPHYGTTTVTAVGSLFTNNGFGFIAICFSLFSNTASTFLVAYRAWKHGRITRALGSSRAEQVLTLLVESGIAYSILWTFILGSQIAWIVSPTGLGASSWSNGIVYFTEGCLVAFVGIYPTVIIALVAMNKSPVEKPASGYLFPTAPMIPLSPVSASQATSHSRMSGPSAFGGASLDSVLLIGRSSRDNGAPSSSYLSDGTLDGVDRSEKGRYLA